MVMRYFTLHFFGAKMSLGSRVEEFIATDDGLVSNNYLFCVSEALVAGIWRDAIKNPAVSRRM